MTSRRRREALARFQRNNNPFDQPIGKQDIRTVRPYLARNRAMFDHARGVFPAEMIDTVEGYRNARRRHAGQNQSRLT